MLFTVTHPIKKTPTYPELLELARRNGIQFNGTEQSGEFTARGISGTYVFDQKGDLRGHGTGLGVTGSFELANGQAEIQIIEKPFFIPEAFLKAKLLEGLQAFSANADTI